MLTGPFSLPSYIDLGATFLFALSGAMVAIRRRYDVVGLFALAFLAFVSLGLPDGVLNVVAPEPPAHGPAPEADRGHVQTSASEWADRHGHTIPHLSVSPSGM